MSSGNEDICYYNTRCATPFFNVSAFNNLFSNIGYIILGVLYISVTYLRYGVVCGSVMTLALLWFAIHIQAPALSEVGKEQC